MFLIRKYNNSKAMDIKILSNLCTESFSGNVYAFKIHQLSLYMSVKAKSALSKALI